MMQATCQPHGGSTGQVQTGGFGTGGVPTSLAAPQLLCRSGSCLGGEVSRHLPEHTASRGPLGSSHICTDQGKRPEMPSGVEGRGLLPPPGTDGCVARRKQRPLRPGPACQEEGAAEAALESRAAGPSAGKNRPPDESRQQSPAGEGQDPAPSTAAQNMTRPGRDAATRGAPSCSHMGLVSGVRSFQRVGDC